MRSNYLSAVICIFVLLESVLTDDGTPSPWRWACENGKCLKTRLEEGQTPGFSLEACKMFCNDYGLLWPRPTGDADLGNFLSKINMSRIELKIVNEGAADDLMKAAAERFKRMVALAIPKDAKPKMTGKALVVELENSNPDLREFSLDMDESYGLHVRSRDPEHEKTGSVIATITANSFFGIRHGLETLSQLFVYDDLRAQLLMVRDARITDKPAYPYRGLLLDTARNFYTVESIKKTIDAMAAVKLNTFHWHITDSQSFPFQSTKRPELTKLGAFSPSKVYTKEVIREIVKFGLERGVRVLPEFDAPAHVGEGWQDSGLTVCFKVYTKEAIREIVRFGLERGVRVLPEFDAPAHVGEGWQDSGLTVCFKAEPWRKYCVEPPCGQLNPTKDELYDYLEDIYTEMAELFNTTDMFHMGGDEVSEKCWNSSESIQNYMVQNRWDLGSTSFLKLWNYFQKKAEDRAYKAFGKKIPLILWTSTLTNFDHVDKYLSKDDYIIQVWTTGLDPQIQGLLSKGYRLIMSNYDALYLDCGFGAWVGSGNNWCSPYIGWQKVYDNSPAVMAMQHKDLILGGEAALWSEQSDSSTLDNRLWPRAAALAERLWAEPATTWLDAEHRMLHTRERLVRMGIQAESIQPEWCYQNEGFCYS